MKTSDDIFRYTPIASALIIILSGLRQLIFFGAFHINIFSYLELTEFITIFIKDGIFFLVILGITSLSFFALKTLEKVINFKKLWIKILTILILLILPLTFLIRSTTDKIKANQSGVELQTFILIVFWIFVGMTVIYLLRNPKLKIKEQLIYNSILSALFVISFSIYNIYQVSHYNHSINYKVKIGNRIIETDSNLVRLARTEKYFFLYNKKEKQTTVLKNEKIDELIINNSQL